MFALAIVLLIAAAALVLWVIFGLNDAGNNKIHFDGFGITADLSPLTLFLLGALALLLVWAATRLIAAGTKRGMRKRRERKTLEKEHKLHEKDRLAAERDRDALRDERDAEAHQRETAEARQRVAERDVARSENDHRTDANYVRGTEPQRGAHSDVRDADVRDAATDGRHYRD